MSDLFLGVIAASVLVMAAIQAAVLVVAARAARRLDQLTARVEEEIRPIIASLQALSADAARAATLATAQVDRADRLLGALAVRVEQTLAAAQETLLAPAREGFAWLAGFKAMVRGLQELRAASRPRPGRVEGEDALFIG